MLRFAFFPKTKISSLYEADIPLQEKNPDNLRISKLLNKNVASLFFFFNAF